MATTHRENLLRALRRQGFDWAPVDSGSFCPSQVDAFRARFGHADVAAWFGNPARFCAPAVEPSYVDGRALYRREELPPDTSIDAWGVGHSRRPGCWHMTRMHHPLRGEDVTLDEIRRFPLPRLASDAAGRLQHDVEAIHVRGFAAMAGMACTVWEIAWYLRSMEDLMADMMAGDERAAVHLDRVTDHAVERIRLCAAAGADLVQLGDDVGMQRTTMMSLDLWRQWLRPRLARIVDAGREIKPDLLVFYHSCGYVLPFVEDLIAVGVDVLNPVQPECMDFADVHRLAAGRLSFWGTVGTQTTLPFGTPGEVRAVVERNLRTCGAAGGLVVAPTHVVEPEVPWDNLVAMKEAAAAFRP
jgi:uroporphyrinogen decarboxylase